MDIQVQKHDAVLIDKYVLGTGDYEGLLKDLDKLVPRQFVLKEGVEYKVWDHLSNNSDKVNEFYKAFADVYPEIKTLKDKLFPLVNYSRVKKEVTFWPNIMGTTPDYYGIYNNWKKLCEQDFDKNPKRWEFDQEKLLMRTEKTSPEKFFRRFLQTERILKDDEVRDLIQKFDAMFGDARMYLCEKVEDYTHQFSCNTGSCMQAGSSYGTPLWDVMKKKYGIWPSAWYHFNPYMQGVYLARNNNTQVLARCFLIRRTVTEKFVKAGGIHAAGHGYYGMLGEYMAEAGYKINSYECARIAGIFEVPGYEHEGEYYCPLPFSDDTVKGFGVYYDSEKKVFVFGPPELLPKGHTVVNSMYVYKGYIPSESVKLPDDRSGNKKAPKAA